jgi:hypothetical protein
MGRWVQTHKGAFLIGAGALMSLSLYVAIREKKKDCQNTGLIFFGLALLVTISLITYTKIRYGYII